VPLLPARSLLAELARRREEAAARLRGQARHLPFLEGLHPKQRAFVEDKSRQKAALCGRRSGKSWGIAAWLLEGGYSDPGGLSVYIARSKGDARMILWPDVLEPMSESFGLGLRLREVDNQLMVYLSNGHRIWLAGCKDVSEVGKFRGKKYRRACVDEAQELPFLRTLVDDSLSWALIDKKGELCIAGTPSPIPAGYFFEATTEGGQITAPWKTHTWTILDNPHIDDAAGELEAKRKRNGWDESHPTYQREALAHWVRDDGALVYPYDGERNAWDGQLLVGAEYVWVLGIDVGVVDETAFVVACCRRNHPEVYVVEAWKRPGLIPSAVAAHVERLQRQYPIAITVVDEGGIGKGYAEEMRQSYGIACEPAEKTRKRTYQEMTSGDLKAGIIRIDPRKCRDLLDELQILQWSPDKAAEDERFANHCADAFLYAVRALRPHYRPEHEPPKPGSREALELEAKKIREEAKRRARERSRQGWRGELPRAA
jgi:hypothetical protein